MSKSPGADVSSLNGGLRALRARDYETANRAPLCN